MPCVAYGPGWKEGKKRERGKKGGIGAHSGQTNSCPIVKPTYNQTWFKMWLVSRYPQWGEAEREHIRNSSK